MIAPEYPLLIAGHSSFGSTLESVSASTRTRSSTAMSLYRLIVTACGPRVSMGCSSCTREDSMCTPIPSSIWETISSTRTDP